MASTTTAHSIPSPAKSKKDKTRGNGKDKERKEKAPQHAERLKTVIRKLPPNLPEEIFWQSVQTWVTDETVSWKLYYPGKFRSRLNKENVPSRAYVVFRSEEQLALFSKEYDGHLFKDKAGNESQAVVEFAPYQKVPPEKKKIDPRNGTIEKDENYISFIKSLAVSANPEPVSLETLIASTQPVPQPKTTPLLEALKAEKTAIKEKAAVKEKVAIMRNAAIEASRKEEAAKKKGVKPANEPSASSSVPYPNRKALSKKPGSNVNNASGTASTPAAGGPPVKSGGPPPKFPKAARQSTPSQPQAPTQPPTKVLAHTPSAAPSLTSESQSQPDVSSSPAVAAPPRRLRPILGLASRQFEAALSGAGVNAGERKSRKEREREREAAATANKEKERNQSNVSGAGEDAPSTSGNVPTTTNANSTVGSSSSKQIPSSPKRDRSVAKRKNSVSSSGALIATVPKVPSILQRAPGTDALISTISPAILQREGVESVAGQSPSVEASSGIRGGRRGRGRGRGGSGPNPTPSGRSG
ncbi:Smg-4/UPF3 family-domain-containing protein [Lentinula aciculospora]|uniref:Smg-4/UPF3 family-domain-containing protein n=1 Tax=Lentinula aciculospora TaxID=153920 RepID=A0A9W9AU58_9AGAR|nr:Smg-4/UPF3 family-domain-containing protein [Lentinula aciculospora]